MIISGKIEGKENEKVKAYINLDVNGFQLKGFKLYEDEEKNLKLLYPSIMIKDENGNYKLDEKNKPINKNPIIINPELNNSKKLFEKLEKTLVDTYNEFKGKGLDQMNKEVEIEELTKGELNTTSFNIAKSKGETQNPDICIKSSNNVYIGAFRVNNVLLFYNAEKNDFTFSCPSYESAQKGKQSFFVPKTQELYKKLKDNLVAGYKEQDKKFKNELKEKKIEEEKKQAREQAKAMATQTNDKPIESQAPTMK